jgi:hypothetical protein
MNYRDVRKRAQMIQYVVEEKIMPPWHPEDGHGELAGRRWLSKKDRKTISRWVESGMARGPAEKLPALPKFPTSWGLSEPDLIVTMDKTFKVTSERPLCCSSRLVLFR